MKKQYVVRFYPPKERAKIETSFIDEDKIWEAISLWHRDGSRIAVFEVGKCLIDWS